MAERSDHENLTFKIGPDDVGVRLDAFLASQIEGWSRARLQRVIEAEDVLVNGKPSKPSYKLREHDELEVDLTLPATTSFTPEALPIEIVHEDDTLVVVNKPAGLVVHPAAGIHSGTLANALAYHFQQLPNASSVRPGIVHRLDRDTSGLLVVAKTESALEHLSDQFRDRSVYKSYVALVHGRVPSDSGRIEEPLARDRSNRTRMAVVRGGRSALSIYRVNLRFNRFTLLDVELKTGRTHQIRVHLAWLKHPVVGDETYGGGRDNTIQNPKLKSQIRSLGRQFLHAEKLAFAHPKTGERVLYQSPLPPELSNLLMEITE
ncbi:MAG TPA: RluA family pseudouridine synthase [Pyrinomonadaceae bacterium]|nr:RluA family pseudouridine synthase [Pyrinomonadaceae bacterium]